MENSILLDRLDMADLPPDHPCYTMARKKVPGFFSDEVGGNIMTEFCALRAKSYAYHVYTGEGNVEGGRRSRPRGSGSM